MMSDNSTYYFASDDGVVKLRSKAYKDRNACEKAAKAHSNSENEVVMLFKQTGSKSIVYGSIG